MKWFVMKSTDKLILLLLLVTICMGVKAADDSGRIFRPITASDGLADNSAQTIKCTKSGRMTITTIGNINFFDGASFTRIDPDEEVIYQLEDYHGHYHLYYDNNHHLWLKSSSGVSCVFLTTEHYETNMDSLFTAYGAKERVTDMFVDVNGDVWLNDGKVMHCQKYTKEIPLLKGRNLQDLEVYGKQILLFYDDGQLLCYDLPTGRKLYQNRAYGEDEVKTYHRSGVQLMYENGLFMIRNGEVGAILMHYNIDKRVWSEVMRSDYHLNNMVVHDGKLYIASEWGYFTYELRTGEIVHNKTITMKDGTQQSTDINVIEFDLQGGMWLGTEMRGVLYDSPLNAKFRILPWTSELALKYEEMMHNLTGIYEFKGKKANVMLIDSRKWTWVGTPNGLYLYMSPQAAPVVFSRRNGFLNGVIHSVIEDDMHNVWASTSYGISCVRIKDGTVKQVYCFNDFDNVPNETFINAKAIKLPSGEIVMQALDHVVTFDPKQFVPIFDQDAYVMHPKLTRVMVNGIVVSAGEKVDGKVVLEKAVSRTRDIVVDYNLNSISLTFSALNYARPLQTCYRVRIQELDREYREYSYFNGKGLVDGKGLLHLPLLGLKPGKYTIEVQASVVPGNYPNRPYIWTIEVKEPWWRMTGIIMLLGFVVFGMAVLNFVVYNRNVHMKIKRNNEEGDLIRRFKAYVERCDHYSKEKLAPTLDEICGRDDGSVELSEEFVETMLKIIPYVHSGNTMTMHILSEEAEMDMLEFYELANKNIYKNPRALIRSMRLDQVAERLLATDDSVAKIALECGFISPNYMMAKFYHRFKMTPQEFRQHNK